MANTIVTMTSPDGATLNTAGTYCENDIEIIPKLQEKTATTGEVVTSDAGYAGLKSVDTTPVFEAGRKAWMDSYIDTSISDASYKFAGASWTDETYTPTKDIKNMFGAQTMYYACSVTGSLEEIHQRCGITLDFSTSTNFENCFAYSKISGVGEISCTRQGYDIGLVRTFYYARRLEKISKIIVTERVIFGNTFDTCTALTYLKIEGTIGKNGFNVSWSPLSKASLVSIVNALSAATTGLTVTLRLAAVNTAFETSAGAADGSTSDEWTALIATKPNWTINLINS